MPEALITSSQIEGMPDWARAAILCYAAAYVFLMLYTAIRLGERYWKPLIHPPHAERSLRPPAFSGRLHSMHWPLH